MPRLFAWETELPKPDLEACQALRLGPGKIAVEMAPLETSRGGLYLPDKERKNRRPSIGVVLGLGALPGKIKPTEGIPKHPVDGEDASGWPIVYDRLKPGAVVFVRPDDGKRIEGFGIGRYQTENEVRLLGVMCLYKGHPRVVPWDESVLGVWDPMTRTARALGNRVLLRLPGKAAQTASGLWIPDEAQSRTDIAEVASAGAYVFDYREGDTVTFERRALHEIHAEDGVTYAFIHAEAIYAKIEEPELAAA